MRCRALPALVAAILLSACSGSCGPSASRRVDIELVNRCEHAIVIHARTGSITRRIALAPGDRFSGWIVSGGAAVDIELLPGVR